MVIKRGWIYTTLKNDDMCIYADFEVLTVGIYYTKLGVKNQKIGKGFLPFSSVLKIQFKEEHENNT